MTQKRLAELCGVSVGTVSKAFKGSRDVGEATREKIFRIAKENGCYHKYIREGHDRPVVAIICQELIGEHCAEIVTALEKAVRRRGGDAVISVAHYDDEETARLFDFYAETLRVSGIICVGQGGAIRNREKLPAVLIGKADDREVETVDLDLSEAVTDAVMLLQKKGHRRIGFIGEAHTRRKLECFKNAMRKAGLPLREEYIVVTNERFAEAGYEGMCRMIENKTLPTAILAAYDYMAFGVLRAAAEHGLRVPEDLSVIGFDDIPLSSYIDVPLSSIRSRFAESCDAVIDLLFCKMENRHFRARQKLSVSSDLIVRRSVAEIAENRHK